MWVLLALVAAVGTALRDVASKRAVRRADPIVVALGIAAVPAIALGAIVLVAGPAAPGPGFWLALLISGGINAVTTPLVVVALQRSDLSLVAPLTSLTPLFMLGTGVVVLGELPGPAGMAGVVTIVAGAYLLALPERSTGPLGPLRALLHDPGARAMLLVAFLYSISATYDKVGARASSPLFWAAAVHALVALALAPLAARRLAARYQAARRQADRHQPGRPQPVRQSPATGHPDRSPWPADILLAGTFAAIIAAAQMTAILLTLAAHVIAVKRTSTLFGVAFGHSVFGERHVRERMLGAAVMVVGFLLLTL